MSDTHWLFMDAAIACLNVKRGFNCTWVERCNLFVGKISRIRKIQKEVVDNWVKSGKDADRMVYRGLHVKTNYCQSVFG